MQPHAHCVAHDPSAPAQPLAFQRIAFLRIDERATGLPDLVAIVNVYQMTVYTWLWLGLLFAIGLASAFHHRKPILLLLVPASVIYVLMSSSVWLIHGLRGLFTGREPQRDKPTRYTHVVG